MKHEHIVKFESGYDCLVFECRYDSPACKPGAGGSHGHHGLAIRFIVKGEEGAVQFLLSTGLTPQAGDPQDQVLSGTDKTYIMPTDLGYHSKTPRYDDQEPISMACDLCDKQPCYYDGSCLQASTAMHALVNGGDEGIWSFLEGYYDHIFHDQPYPEPVKYGKPVRKEQ